MLDKLTLMPIRASTVPSTAPESTCKYAGSVCVVTTGVLACGVSPLVVVLDSLTGSSRASASWLSASESACKCVVYVSALVNICSAAPVMHHSGLLSPTHPFTHRYGHMLWHTHRLTHWHRITHRHTRTTTHPHSIKYTHNPHPHKLFCIQSRGIIITQVLARWAMTCSRATLSASCMLARAAMAAVCSCTTVVAAARSSVPCVLDISSEGYKGCGFDVQ